MRLIPLHGRTDVPFGASYAEVLDVLGYPDEDVTVHDIESHPKGRRTLTYGDFSLTIGADLGVFGMGTQATSEPLTLWDTRIDGMSADEFAAFLISKGARSKTAPPTAWGATDVYSAEFGILAYFAGELLSSIEITIPYSCPTEY